MQISTPRLPYTSTQLARGQIYVSPMMSKYCRTIISSPGYWFNVHSCKLVVIGCCHVNTFDRFMAMAEPQDFVHVFDAKEDFARCQEVDLFGEISGISFSPDGEALFVGIADRTYGSLLEFHRNRNDKYRGAGL